MTKAAQRKTAIERVRRNGHTMVLLEESEYERLRQKADEWEPLMPELLPSGNYPAAEAVAVIQAQTILRWRRKLGLSQAELARRAGVRPETLNRIEHGKNKPSVPTITKIDRALRAAENETADVAQPESKPARGKAKAGKVK